MTTLQEAEMTRRRWERSISQGSSNAIGEVDTAFIRNRIIVNIIGFGHL